MSRLCVPTNVPISPLRLREDYRDYYGDAHARLAEMFDGIQTAGCYEPRIFHAPDTLSENTGLPPGGYLEYMLALPAGGFIVGFLHACVGLGSAPGDPDIAPQPASFTVQITDVKRAFNLFGKPLPETYFLNDAPVNDFMFSFQPDTGPAVLLPSPRLLPAPYPIAPPGVFKIQFWNQAPADDLNPNTFVRLSVLVAIPNPDAK